jgi:hypothetical protein
MNSNTFGAQSSTLGPAYIPFQLTRKGDSIQFSTVDGVTRGKVTSVSTKRHSVLARSADGEYHEVTSGAYITHVLTPAEWRARMADKTPFWA